MFDKLNIGSKFSCTNYKDELTYIKIAHGIFMLYINGEIDGNLYNIYESFTGKFVGTIVDNNGMEIEYNNRVTIEVL